VRPPGFRGNDDTREETAGRTRRVSSGACQLRRGIDRQSGNLFSRRAVFPGAAAWVARPGTGDRELVFPVRDLSKDFLRLAENGVIQSGAESVCQMEGDSGFPRGALWFRYRLLPFWRQKHALVWTRTVQTPIPDHRAVQPCNPGKITSAPTFLRSSCAFCRSTDRLLTCFSAAPNRRNLTQWQYTQYFHR
jgi:hypothetical protein